MTNEKIEKEMKIIEAVRIIDIVPNNNLKRLFYLAHNENDATFILQIYTSATQFYDIVNNHLAQYS
jgi:hypothetical protein